MELVAGTHASHHRPGDVWPGRNGIASVSVVAARAAQAEILAKWVYVAGFERGVDILRTHGLAGVIIGTDGKVVREGHAVAAAP